MATGVQTWSKTASNNASADSSVNWREQQAPSSVNDSARGMMASVAKWRDDISGVLATSGTSTAYTITSNQGFASLPAMDGAVIAFTPHATNGAAPTLSVDGLTAKPLRAASGADLQTNVLLSGTPYVALYNNANAEFVLQGFSANPYGIPLAAGMDYWADTTPGSAYAFPTGQAISRTTYATLFSFIGTRFGSGDGSMTFNLPDKTERVSVMVAGTASRLTSAYFGGDSTVIGATGGSENVSMTMGNLIQHDHTAFLHDPGHNHTISPGASGGSVSPSGLTSFKAFGDPNTQNTDTKTTGITLWSDGDNVGTQNKVGKTGSATPTPMRTVQPTIVCNYIMRII
jgi:microcystin-dependent protein